MKKHLVFISHSYKDLKLAQAIKMYIDSLENFQAELIMEQKDPMKLLTQKVENGLERCTFIIPILTENSINNQWVNQEIGFARALKKHFIPIIQRTILSDLKGFINQSFDLPHNFEIGELSKTEYVLGLIGAVETDLYNKAKEIDSENISELFTGKWTSTFKIDGRLTSEHFEIKKNGTFTTNHDFKFQIKNVFIDNDDNSIYFEKHGLNDDKRILKNQLKIINRGQKYSGKEINTLENSTIEISYRKSV
jgi:hypothetical protein